MKAVGFRRSLPVTDPECLVDAELPDPVPGDRDLLVAVAAVAVNPVDTKVRLRAQPEGLQVLGWDVAGTVVGTGPAVTRFQPGDRVFYAGDMTRPGANSEFHVVDERLVGHTPGSLDDIQAAALPLTAITAWELLFDRLQVADGSGSLLIVGAAGGVGSIAVQLAATRTGLTVIGTASREDTTRWVSDMGADHVIDHSRPLVPQVAELGAPPVRYIASLTHTGQHFPELAELVAAEGAIGLIDDPDPVPDITVLKRKSVSIHWEFMFTRSLFGTSGMAAQGRILEEVARLVDEGTIRTTLGATGGRICAANLRAAHAVMESHTAVGKIVLAGW